MLKRLKVSSGFCKVTTSHPCLRDKRVYMAQNISHPRSRMTLTERDESPVFKGQQQVRDMSAEIFVPLLLLRKTSWRQKKNLRISVEMCLDAPQNLS